MIDRQPALFLSHGAPPLADDARWTSELRAWGGSLGKPKDILMVSAHWENAPATVSSTTPHTPLVRDFWGFPQKYYEVPYDAPVAPDLAQRVAGLVGGRLYQDPERGLDHGAYVPLVEMFPDADVPVLQLSLPTLDVTELFQLGRTLAPLRDEGTLIIGSGFTTHNLRLIDFAAGPDAVPPAWSAEFDAWASEVMAERDLASLLDFERVAPAAKVAHPRTEHWAPLYVALGAAYDAGLENTCVIDGSWGGLSKRSWQFT